MPAPTVAGMAATLRDAASLLERDGWCQQQAQSASGRRCAVRAITTVAEASNLEAYFTIWEVERFLAAANPLMSDLASWQDVPGRTLADVCRLLRNVAQFLTPTGVRLPGTAA